MKRILLFILTLSAAISLGAQSKIITESIESEKLGCEQKYNVYLPAGYDASVHYPVIYLLHGLYGTYQDWDKAGRVKDVADELIRSGECVPVVILMPNAGAQDVHNYQNGYFNVKDWPYEDFFFQEFLPAAEKKFNCGGAKGQRAIMGLSMGGGGSICYAQLHPDMFSSSYGMSAWLDNKWDEVASPKQSEEMKKSKLLITARSVTEHSALDFMDKADEACVEQLKTLRWFLDCGDDDGLLRLSVDLYGRMRRAGLKAELRVRDGGHTWEYWHTALRQSLPFASRNFQ